MLQSHVKGVPIISPHLFDVSKHDCRISLLKVANYELSIQNRRRLSSCQKYIIRARNIVDKCDTFTSIEKIDQVHETRLVRRQSLPFTIQPSFTNQDDDDKVSGFFLHLSKQLDVFYRFSRPHTIIGTLIGVTSVSLLPIESLSDLSRTFFVGWLKTLIPAILMNIYVVGLNQLFDIEIDKVNKPNLPIASGAITIGVGSTIVLTCCLFSFAIGFGSKSLPLIMALLICFFLGSAYSLDFPYLRWKKQPFLAASCIVIVRAMTLQIAFFIHIQKYVLGKAIRMTKPVLFATTFMCFFVTVIALFKDIPDIDGDRHFGIQSLSITLGKQKVFWLCVKLLIAAYGSAVAIAAISPLSPSNILTILGHTMLASVLWSRAQCVNLADNASITSFYMFIWKLFYAEYFLIPFIR